MEDSKSLVKKAMNLEETERPPVFSFFSPQFLEHKTPLDFVDFYFPEGDIRNNFIKIAQEYNFDGTFIINFGYPKELKRQIKKLERGKIKKIYFQNNFTLEIPEFGYPRWYGPFGKPLKLTLEDLDPEEIFYWEPWLPPSNIIRKYNINFNDIIDSGISIHGIILSPFSQLLLQLGYEELILGITGDPLLIKSCLERLVNECISFAIKNFKSGYDALMIDSPYTSDEYISKKIWNDFVFEYEKIIAEKLEKELRIPVYLKIHGPFYEKAVEILSSPFKGIFLPKESNSDIPIMEAMSIFEGKKFMIGSFDLGFVLGEMRENEVRNYLRSLRTKKGLILSPSDPLSKDTDEKALTLLKKVILN